MLPRQCDLTDISLVLPQNRSRQAARSWCSGFCKVWIQLNRCLSMAASLIDQRDIGQAGKLSALSNRTGGCPEIPRATLLQIVLSQHKSIIGLRPSLAGARFPPHRRFLGSAGSMTCLRRAQPSPAELVQLRQTKSVCAFDQHHGGVGDIHAHFDD